MLQVAKQPKVIFVFDREVDVADILDILVLMGRRDKAELTPEEEELFATEDEELGP